MAEDAPCVDQPPEVGLEPEPSDLPPVLAAAERVGEFVGWFGDGRVDAGGGPPLFARDLEALARAATRLSSARAALEDVMRLHRRHGDRCVSCTGRRADVCERCGVPAPCATARAADAVMEAIGGAGLRAGMQ